MKEKRFIQLFVLLSLSLLISLKSVGQPDSLPKVKVMVRAFKDKILLRWAPTTPLAWQQANKYGYSVERITMTRKNKLIKQRTVKPLTINPIRPFTEDQWEKVVSDDKGNVDNYAAIAVQAIYGESFELTGDYSGNMMKVIEKAQDNEKRFTFALFAADQSLKVATAMGLMYEDKDVVEDEKYLYRIYANVPHQIELIDTGFVYIGPADAGELPKPLDFNAEFADKEVTLSWNRELFEQIYSTYVVERSDNGKDFYPLSDLPFINTSPTDKPNPRLMYRVDSLPDNNITYHYRIQGHTIFDEFGPWSDTISGQSTATLKFRPAIMEPEVIDNKKIKIQWEFPLEQQDNIEYFGVYRAEKEDGEYVTLAENLNNNIRNYVDEKPLPTNYYIIRAFDDKGQSGSSFPALGQLIDSIPPSQPESPKAIIDSLGNVSLFWKKGKEEDIVGYRVFRSNFIEEEFGQITSAPVKDTIFTEQIKLNNLSNKIYYRIAAIDRNFNQSELSKAVLLLKPDIIPPSPPLFKASKSTSEGVVLEWINTSSKDVAKHVLYRRQADKENWVTIAVFPVSDSINTFTDKQIPAKALFEYAMLAVDSANNESKPGKSVFASKIDNGIRPKIEDLESTIDLNNKWIELSWKYKYLDVKNFIIYRSIDQNPLQYYKMISATENNFKDTNMIINTSYKYRVKAVFVDGSESGFSKEINLKF